MFYFKRNTTELKDMLYTSSRALGLGAASRSLPLQPAKEIVEAPVTGYRGNCRQMEPTPCWRGHRHLVHCAVPSEIGEHLSAGWYPAVGALYQSGTREKQKEPSDWKELKNTLHLLHASNRTDSRLSWGTGGNHMQNHKAQGAEQILGKIQGKHCKMRLIFHDSSKHSKQTLYVLRTLWWSKQCILLGKKWEVVLSQRTALQVDNVFAIYS